MSLRICCGLFRKGCFSLVLFGGYPSPSLEGGRCSPFFFVSTRIPAAPAVVRSILVMCMDIREWGEVLPAEASPADIQAR